MYILRLPCDRLLQSNCWPTEGNRHVVDAKESMRAAGIGKRMADGNATKLELVKQRVWFYEFELPDGTLTQCDLPKSVRPIHVSRRSHLRRIIEGRVGNPRAMTAIDFASHEGYYSIELAKHFALVLGIEFRPDSLAAARLITEALGVGNVRFVEADLQQMPFDSALCADFVLVYGLIYHMEDPIHVLRLAAQLCRQHILVETQIFPYDVSGRVEDGFYNNLRPVNGVFGLVPDYPQGREGGSTDLALVPSLNALLFLLRCFGFAETEVIPAQLDDYEQFCRGSRVIVYGRKRADV
jgi:tRNA (mo5U34)-methyltransferase